MPPPMTKAILGRTPHTNGEWHGGRLANSVKWALKPIRAVLGKLDQGMVFTCGRAADYPFCPVFGIAITARCDIAQDKAEIYSYLPAVGLRDWWHIDGCRIVKSRAESQQFGNLRQIIKQVGLSDSILKVQTPRSVAEVLFPEGADGARGKNRARVMTLVDSLERLSTVDPAAGRSTDVQKLCLEFGGLRRAVMDELVTQRLTGHYFIPQLEPDGHDHGYVVLLREVRHLPRVVGESVASGLPRPDESVEPVLQSQAPSHLCFDHQDFAMPIGILPSPLIEHIMQCFALLFTRIGLDDLPDDYLTGLWARQGLDAAGSS